MQELLKSIQIKVNEKIYVKDPESSELGKNIIKVGMRLIHEIGLESFTFKKLATELNTTESAIYRYFENKHKLLIYLIAWFWGWLEYEIVLGTSNLEDPELKLRKCIDIISSPLKNNPEHDSIDLNLLYSITVDESHKAFLTKEVDEEFENGLFQHYWRIHERLAQFILEVNGAYPYTHSMASTLLGSAVQLRFLSWHIPNLTDKSKNEEYLETFLSETVLKAISA